MRAHDPGAVRISAGLVAFAEVLRGLGIPIAVSRVEVALEALAAVDARDREQCYWALRSALISDAEHVPVFDSAFAALCDGELPAPMPAPMPEAAGAQDVDRRDSDGATDSGAGGSDDDGSGSDDGSAAGARWSAIERLRDLDFRAYGPDELSRAARLMSELARSLPLRPSRRLRPDHAGRYLDRRATVRGALRTEGHPLQLAWRRTSSRPRRLVFVVDVSGSMEPYARPVVMFLHAARQVSSRLEAFAFGTRLTRLTEQLDRRRPDAALRRVAEAVPDWAGGTRIGENLKRLNDVWGARGITRGAAVVIVSDGWERGDVELLREQVARLQRSSRRTVWVNPLAGDPDYEPLAAGMAAALPHVDVFLPGHNLRSFEALTAVLAEPRAARRARAERVAGAGLGAGTSRDA